MSTSQEIDDHRAQAVKLAELFKARPLQDIEPEELRQITPHYQQRISLELRKGLKMRIVNVPRWIERHDWPANTDGSVKKQKRDGAYRFMPYEPLGRDAGEFIERGWKQDGPFTEEFRLTSK